MKSKFISVFLLLLGSLIAQEPLDPTTQQFGYMSVGVGPLPVLLPAFAGGYRTQSGHHGADLSLQVSTVVAFTQVKANLLYHYYFKPNTTSEFYVGAGVGPSYLFGRTKEHLLISPEVVFGKQYQTDTKDPRFFQIQLSFPTFAFRAHDPQCHIFYFPLVIFSYGIGF